MTASSEQARPIVEAIGLTKDFSDFWMRSKARAVDGIDFEIRERGKPVNPVKFLPSRSKPPASPG